MATRDEINPEDAKILMRVARSLSGDLDNLEKERTALAAAPTDVTVSEIERIKARGKKVARAIKKALRTLITVNQKLALIR